MTSITATLTNLAAQYFGSRFDSLTFGIIPGTVMREPVWYVTCKPILGVAQRINLGTTAHEAERALRMRIANAEKSNRLAKMHAENEANKRAPGYTAGFYTESGLPRDPEAFNAAVAAAELAREAAAWTPGGAPDMSEMDEDEREELMREALSNPARRAEYEAQLELESGPADETLSAMVEAEAERLLAAEVAALDAEQVETHAETFVVAPYMVGHAVAAELVATGMLRANPGLVTVTVIVEGPEQDVRSFTYKRYVNPNGKSFALGAPLAIRSK